MILNYYLKTEAYPRTRIRLLALSHLQNNKNYKQVAEYMQVDIIQNSKNNNTINSV
ncbi:hypothetical protein BSPWISOXPB_2429 [uncultured Gammaproteobacteria bacterium]|nr:hypothetical protein BSPWISOXPB_2429 [uncultured Gammaproteobacteria bacterium]